MNESKKYHLVVTSGPTREWIDPVRFLSNPSSGKTGWHIARAGLKLFDHVTYIYGAVESPYASVEGARNVSVDTTEEMAIAVREAIGSDTLLIMAAAPADFCMEHIEEQKIKKESRDSLTIHLRPTIDILKSIADLSYPAFFRVGFAAETGNLEQYALKKLKEKNLDMICGNLVDRDLRGFGSHDNLLHLFTRSGARTTLGPMDKASLSGELLKFIGKMLLT